VDRSGNPTARALFLPTARQTNWLLIVGFLSLGEALYMRYVEIENSVIGVACQTEVASWQCSSRQLAITLFIHQVFGIVALATAALNLFRPSFVLAALALSAACFGLVLHNLDLSGVAVALLILSLARPAPAPE
jgi:hypothetical protein